MTLIEVLIVVAIMSLIAGAVAIFAVPRFEEVQRDAAKIDTKTLVQVVEIWRLGHPGSTECPTFEALKRDGAMRPDRRSASRS